MTMDNTISTVCSSSLSSKENISGYSVTTGKVLGKNLRCMFGKARLETLYYMELRINLIQKIATKTKLLYRHCNKNRCHCGTNTPISLVKKSYSLHSHRTGDSIKVVPKQGEKVEYAREKLAGSIAGSGD